MRVYLALTQPFGIPPKDIEDVDILASYYYLRNNEEFQEWVKHSRDFLCDSGLFTFVNTGVKVDLERYADQYADFVRENNIKDYIELDVDEIKGVAWTRKLRDRIEKRVGWQSIPVFHVVRGKESFIQDCKDYKRICVGFMLSEGLPNTLTHKYVPWFIDKAHENDCRIHGLGFTKTTILENYAFDSVDSSSFSAGGRYGTYQYFDPSLKQMKQVRCGDNGIFKGVPLTAEEKTLAEIASCIYKAYPYDGKYILDGDRLIICQSNAPTEELRKVYPNAIINPLGDWTGGSDVDAGATNRKLGSDMAQSVTGGGLHGKDLSKADVSVNIYAFLQAQATRQVQQFCCAIGDDTIDGRPYAEIVEIAREYIQSLGGFEKFAEWGLY